MFDFTENARRRATLVCTAADLDRIVADPQVAAICSDLLDADEKLKRGEFTKDEYETYKQQQKIKLPALMFHSHFSDGHRHNASAEPSGLSILDIDHINDPRGMWAKWAPMAKKLNIALAHVTPSGRGLRIVFAIPSGLELAHAQQRMAKRLGLPVFDDVCKDPARCSFAVPKDYVLYRDDAILFNESLAAAYRTSIGWVAPEAKKAAKASTRRAAKKTETKTPKTANDVTISHPESGSAGPVPAESNLRQPAQQLLTEATPDDITLFAETCKEAGLKADHIDRYGSRHNNLVAVLSTGITRLMPIATMRKVVEHFMPTFSQDQNCQQLINDFYDKYTDPNRPMSQRLARLYARSHKADMVNEGKEVDIEQEEAEAQAKLEEELLEVAPRGIKETLNGVPQNMRFPVVCAVLPLAAAYADAVTVQYCDGGNQRLGLMSIIVGPQASGKSVCSKRVALWLRQMEEGDDKQRAIEEKWKEAKKGRKANEKAPEDPHVIIRNPPVTISCSTLLKRLKNAHGHCLYSFGEELDTLLKTNGAGSWSQKFDVYRLAFDNGKWGQDYNSDQAESGLVEVAYNITMLGTYGSLRKCFKGDNVENGLSSRMILAEMPDNAFAAMPKVSEIEADCTDIIEQSVTRLKSALGFVDTPQLRATIGDWVECKRLEAMADGDLVKDTYRKRAAVIGFRAGVVASILEGGETENVCRFAALIANYVIEKQTKFFGETFEEQVKVANGEPRATKTDTLFASLPEEFEFSSLLARRKGKSYSSCRVLLSRWKKQGWIERMSVNTYRKKAC